MAIPIPTGIKLPYALTDVHSNIATSREIYELAEEGLIGAESHSLGFHDVANLDSMKEVPFIQWSEQANTQWWAYVEEGPVGEQAADYLQQMVEERRQIAKDYMEGFHDLGQRLAEALQDEGEPTTDMDQLLDNVAAGRAPAELENGQTLAKADVINAFWQQNQADIEALQAKYTQLQEFPQQLDEWMDGKGIERTPELNAVLEKHRYSGMGDGRVDSEALVGSTGYTINQQGSDPFIDLEMARTALYRFDDPFPPGSTGKVDLKAALAQEVRIGLTFGDAGLVSNTVARHQMKAERSALVESYQQYFQPTYDAFYEQLGAELEPSFSYQDLIDNLKAGLPPAAMEDGSLHPAADQIMAYVDEHQSRLDMVQQLQTSLESFPKSMTEWLETNQQKVNDLVYSLYGLEPWETGEYARGMRQLSIFSFDGVISGDKQERLQQLKVNAEAHAETLANNLADQLSGNWLQAPFSLDQLVDNFRHGRPLGEKEDGSLHPQYQQIEAFGAEFKDQIVSYIDNLWLLEGRTSPDLEAFGYQSARNMIDELVAQIEQSRQPFPIEPKDVTTDV